MTQPLPLVTIGIPNYNYAGLVMQALESVIQQTYKNIEIVIVDDHSADNSVEVIENWISRHQQTLRVTFIKNKTSQGIARNCNLILANASGKYYQVLDADDLLLPHKIESQVKILEENPEYALVYSNIFVMDRNNQTIYEDYLEYIGYDHTNMPSGDVFKQMLLFNFIPNPSVLINTGMAKKIGGYDESLQVQDYYLYLTLSQQHNFWYQDDTTAAYRIHEKSLSNSDKTNSKSIEGSLRLLSRYYAGGDADFKAHFKKSVYNMAPYFYKHNYPSANYWIKRNAVLNPGIKSWGYFLAYHLHLPYAFFEIIKARGLVKNSHAITIL